MITLKHLYQLVKPYRQKVILVSILLLIGTAIDLTLPAILRQVIDVGLTAGNSHVLLYSALLVVGLGVVRMILTNRHTYLTRWISQKTAYDLRSRLYDHIQRLSFTYHDHVQSGQLISRCIEDVSAVQNFTGNGFMTLVRVGLLMVGVIILLLVTNTRLALISFIPLIPLALVTISFGRRIGNLFYRVEQTLADLSTRLQENVSGAQVVRAFAREEHEMKRFRETNQALYQVQLTAVRMFARVMPVSHFLVALCTVVILWFGGKMVIDGQLTLGELAAFNSYILLLAMPIQQLSWLVNQAGESIAGLQRANEVLNTEPEIFNPPDAISLPVLQGRVEFRSVHFHYNGVKRPALHGIDLVAEPNQVIALIGPTGSGKTSLINLIPRFYDVTSGAVLVDGYDVRKLELTALRRQIGIVLQTTLLFSMSVRENLAYGNPALGMDEIIAAAKAAQAHDFIMELPEGYETAIGERGVTLSGGQRQRMAIARALLMNPRILIMDDSTSSVDTQTENRIQQALHQLMVGRTTFVIAQRLSTVQRADLILVMENGQIVERGSHSELLERAGRYRMIYEMQLRQQDLIDAA